MASTNDKRTRRRVSDKLTLAVDAESLGRVHREWAAKVAVMRENYDARAARGDLPAIRPVPLELKDELETLIRHAVRRGELQYDPETGHARVCIAPLPEIPEIGAPGWGTAEWDSEFHRRAERNAHERNLSYALGDPRLHGLALSLLEAPHAEPGVFGQAAARDLAHDLALVAHGVRVPPPVAERVRDALPKVSPPSFGTKPIAGRVHAWEAALVVAVVMAHWQSDSVPNAADRVTLVLEMLESSIGTLLPQAVAAKFNNPSEAAFERAKRLMAGLRLLTTKPGGKGAGRSKSEWGAAREFARCFGVAFVEKSSRISRRK
jgi:hypothetical protein